MSHYAKPKLRKCLPTQTWRKPQTQLLSSFENIHLRVYIHCCLAVFSFVNRQFTNIRCTIHNQRPLLTLASFRMFSGFTARHAGRYSEHSVRDREHNMTRYPPTGARVSDPVQNPE